MILFFRGQGFGQEFFRFGLQYGILGTGISRSNRFVVFGGWLQRPSPCLIRSACRRERGWTLSETMSAQNFVF